ncbi:hypothetical protein JL100_015045 [Skermanella mucosa]|uniref:hypothetical protein n=1 Tax=Skermanella mucosa TaxID=1789672 RepID=UPI001E321E04|nr:hypothetical protein [Skermanella mucosa]UEM18445.1 hypothetical protein JL100_015045 [Skermanella mucosa]
MAAISAVFTIARVADILGEDEDLLHDVSLDMEPEDGVLWIYGIGGEEVLAFTAFGIENLRDLIPLYKKPVPGP